MCTLRLLSLIAFHRVCSSPLPLLSQVDEWPINTLSHLPRNSSNCLSGCTFHHSIIYLYFLNILQMEAGNVAAQNWKSCWGCTRKKSDKSIFDFSIALWGAIGHHIKLLDRLKCRLKDWLKWSCSVKALHKTHNFQDTSQIFQNGWFCSSALGGTERKLILFNELSLPPV